MDKRKEGSPEKAEYPMRINRYLALRGYSTRRGVDELIEKKQVFINNRVAVLGDKVNKEDVVEVRTQGTPKKYLYFAYNKPVGIVTHSPQEDEIDIKKKTERFSDLRDIFPVGRLDKDSHGLIILTNDGRVTDRLLNPDYEHDKEYIVRTTRKLRESFKKNMEAGVDIEGYVTKKCVVRVMNDFAFSIILQEGKKHQIRRMVVALHNDVADLERVRVLNIRLADLKPGEYRKIEGKELRSFLEGLGL